MPLDDVLTRLDAVTAELERACEEAPSLPEHGDRDAVDGFLVRAYRATWDA